MSLISGIHVDMNKIDGNESINSQKTIVVVNYTYIYTCSMGKVPEQRRWSRRGGENRRCHKRKRVCLRNRCEFDVEDNRNTADLPFSKGLGGSIFPPFSN